MPEYMPDIRCQKLDQNRCHIEYYVWMSRWGIAWRKEILSKPLQISSLRTSLSLSWGWKQVFGSLCHGWSAEQLQLIQRLQGDAWKKHCNNTIMLWTMVWTAVTANQTSLIRSRGAFLPKTLRLFKQHFQAQRAHFKDRMLLWKISCISFEIWIVCFAESFEFVYPKHSCLLCSALAWSNSGSFCGFSLLLDLVSWQV